MRTFFFLIAAFCCSTSFSQYELKAGYGFEHLHIGMTKSEIIQTLGNLEEEVSMSNEKAMWEDGGYNTNKEMPFVLNFDYVLIFHSNQYYTWKVFFKDEKANYITISAYIASESPKDQIQLDGKFKLGSEESSQLLNYLGTPTLRKDREGSSIYYFLEKGISVNVADGQIVNFWIYAPMNSKQAKKIKKQIS